MTRTFIPALATGILAMVSASPLLAQDAAAQPKLVLQITVDQLRGDLIDRTPESHW